MTAPWGSPDPRDLWKYLTEYEARTGGDILAIPHNGNLSNGVMFPLEAQWNGRKLDETYVTQCNRWEPLVEMTQIKTDGEAYPFLSPDDEFANYETWDQGNLDTSQAKTKDMLAGEYARKALKRGLAIENTRKSIFDAMERKEVYGTTDPRMTVRLFGGWDYTGQDLNSHTPAVVCYEKGVPMGGDLRKAPVGASAPKFMVYALRDPIGANRDRIQIVKGWINKDGTTAEDVYDVVWSDDRKPGADGKPPPVGNTVNVETATWKNTIGSPELINVWVDPDFDASQSAFYYARVIEIPTPRWTAYEALRFGIKMTDNVPMMTQERAYTSPIWYTP